MSWSDMFLVVKLPGKERYRPRTAVNRTPGPPNPTGRESNLGWYLRLAFYITVLLVFAGAVVAVSVWSSSGNR